MAGYKLLQKIRNLEERLDALGMHLGRCKHYDDDNDYISVYPKDDCLPIFTREFALFTGSIEHVLVWVDGIEWSREYDRVCGLKTDQRRAKAEQSYRNKRLLKAIKEPA